MDLVRLVLKNNNLTFNGRHYLQIQGTAIGTKMLQSSRRCKEVIPGVPMVAFRRPKSLKDMSFGV